MGIGLTSQKAPSDRCRPRQRQEFSSSGYFRRQPRGERFVLALAKTLQLEEAMDLLDAGLTWCDREVDLARLIISRMGHLPQERPEGR